MRIRIDTAQGKIQSDAIAGRCLRRGCLWQAGMRGENRPAIQAYWSCCAQFYPRYKRRMPATQEQMSTLIPIGLVVSALLVLGYIVGTELCLPAARHALRSGDMEIWRFACRLVAGGEWAIITVCASFLAQVEDAWHLFTDMQAGKLAGLAAAGLIAGVVFWEIAGHSRRHFTRIMSTSLGLVLPASGRQRELYERLQHQLETGSVTEQNRVLQALVAQRNSRVYG